jgi:type I restriction-modification system DNA methylase subunit
MNSRISHNIKHRDKPNNEFYTPRKLAEKLFYKIDTKGCSVLDSAFGNGNFYFRGDTTTDFFSVKKQYDWIISNPPYSLLDKWLEHSCKISKKGFAYLLGLHNLTPKRIEKCEKEGFYITKLFLCKVFKWFGISAFVIWEKDKKGIIEYDRIVWR